MKILQKIAVAVMGLFASATVFAQSAGEAVFTSLTADATTLIAAGYALLGLVLAGVLGYKLVKKITSRAT